MLQLTDEKLNSLGAIITTKEISGQPQLWQKVFEDYKEKEIEIDDFLNQLLKKHAYLRVIFTGAGSSQYVGDTVQKSLTELGDVKKFRFESIGSTSIVSSPQTTLEKDSPTLLVSFARSGNSPESLAAVDVVENCVTHSYHLIISCAKDGQLAQKAKGMSNAYSIILPDASNDQGFAMTGSASSMTLMATLVFSKESLTEKEEQVKDLVAVTEDILAREPEVAANLTEATERVVYIGSGPLAEIAREAQLKILELTAGKIATLFDSSMGLRHGPKSFVDGHTNVYIFAANDSYSRRYDLDIYEELKHDGIAAHTTLIGQQVTEGFCLKAGVPVLKEAYLVLPMLVFAQIIALNASILVKNTPDTPSATGTVNRVVKGVIIYPLEKK